MKSAATLYVHANSGDTELLDQERNRELWTGAFFVEPPNGDDSVTFVLVAEAFDKNKELLGSGRLKTGFVKGQTRYARLTLSACKKVVEAQLSPSELVPSATLANAVIAECQHEQDSGVGGSGGRSAMSVDTAGTEGGAAGHSHAAADDDGGMPAADTCGDGHLNGDELCDIHIAKGELGACPSACPSADACNHGQLIGTACQAHCEYRKITVAIRDDGCCPAGANASSDNDCKAECGNGVIEAEETCDPPSSCSSCSDSDPCTDDITTGSPATCNVRCANTLHSAPRNSDGCCLKTSNANNDNDCPARCPNGVVEPGELCDGNCPDAAACDDGNSCTTDSVSGSDCQRQCTHTERAASTTSDGCCPRGASESADPDCANLLTGRSFVSSVGESTSEPNHPVGLITDGDDATRWISLPQSPVTLTVDLGASHTLRQIQIIWAGDTIKNFRLEISTDNVRWTPIYTGVTKNEMIEPEVYEELSVEPTGRYFRIYGQDRWNSGWGNSIYEVRLYGR